MAWTVPAEVGVLRARYDRPNDDGLAIVGSFARGDAGQYSDVDVTWFRAEPPADKHEFFSVGNRLVSVLFTTVAEASAQLANPEEAIWAAPGLASMRIIADRTGAIASLRDQAAALDWSDLQQAADAHASRELNWFASEDAAKLLNAVCLGDEYSAANALTGLWPVVAKAVAVHRGIMMASENSWLAAVEEAIGRDTSWSRWLRESSGIDPAPAGAAPLLWRAEAGIRLYRETARLFDAIIQPADRSTITTVCGYIDGWLAGGPKPG